ncbi:hypothetical protein [Paraliobacillus zengyii]|uniref:hypothetical protein n=1 Tax=Paraliobacillus zengyii TaxID=2213194 RepID=UPI000DD3E24F|nr:hypothetical protein [Paraliobacillus zengyii]
MGFYYFIILFIGIFFIVGAVIQAVKYSSLFKKKVIFSGVIGFMLIGLSIFLFTPGSSDIIAELLRLNG